LDDELVVMHSGNIGHAQDLDTLVRAATFLRDLDRLRIMVIGFGARHGELTRLAQRLEVTRAVHFLDYQPREQLPLSLATGDLHYVGLAQGLSGFVVPSRLYGILAAGRPVLVSADADSETARLVEEVGCGIVVPPGRPDLVAGVLRDVVEGRTSLEGMGERGREWVEREADREVAFRRYRALVADVVAGASSSSSR
jgi:glycosyltransferase involved in cell wall biosynthesis